MAFMFSEMYKGILRNANKTGLLVEAWHALSLRLQEQLWIIMSILLCGEVAVFYRVLVRKWCFHPPKFL